MEKAKDFVEMDEAVCRRVRLMSPKDAENLYEAIEQSTEKLTSLLALATDRISESDLTLVQKEIFKEVRKLEKLTIVEAVSAKNFFEVQQHFRSMVRAANVIINWLKGSPAAQRMEALRTEGIELLNDLYEHIKDMEGNERSQLPGVDQQNLKGDPLTAQQRDRFVKVFADFASLFRGFMNVADLFSDDPVNVGGYSDMHDVLNTLYLENLIDLTLKDALEIYDGQVADVNPKKGFFGKFAAKKAGLTGKFKSSIAKAWAAAPGASKFATSDDLANYLTGKTGDQLQAIFQRFNDFVANDVDTNWLLSITKNPRTLGSMLKAVWDAFGSGTMKPIR
jgi:hypothetical protein